MSNFKHIRMEYSLQMNEMGELAGITDRTYQKYDAGHPEYSFAALKKLSDVFAVSIDWLVGETKDRYHKDKILRLEKNIKKPLEDILTETGIRKAEEYFDEAQRANSYSLFNRATIIACVKLIVYFSREVPDSQPKINYRHESMKQQLTDKLKGHLLHPDDYK